MGSWAAARDAGRLARQLGFQELNASAHRGILIHHVFHRFAGVDNRAVIATAMAHPWLPQLWVREVLHEGGGLRRLMFDRIGPLLPRAMAQRFAQLQSQGRLNPRLDPRLLVPSLIGQTMFMTASAPIWRGVLAPTSRSLSPTRTPSSTSAG